MSFVGVLDISSFIWSESAFNGNKPGYYDLTRKIPVLLDRLEKNKSLILIRAELIDEIISNFPFGKVPRDFTDFEASTFSFLGNIGSRLITYAGVLSTDISAIPNLIKEYYSESTATEVGYLVTKLHTDNEIKSVYFTYQLLWQQDQDLKTENKPKKQLKQFETIVSDSESILDAFFLRHKNIFEHSKKHDRLKKNDYEAPLSCYDGKNTDVPQKLLDAAVQSGGSFYSFDIRNDVYVVFRNHINNKFHGFDQTDRNRIPSEIRKIFNK